MGFSARYCKRAGAEKHTKGLTVDCSSRHLVIEWGALHVKDRDHLPHLAITRQLARKDELSV